MLDSITKYVLAMLVLSGCAPISEIPRCSIYQDEYERWRNIDFPLAVDVDEDFSNTAHNVILQSLEAWNEAVGETVFVLSSADEEADVTIEQSELGCNPVCVIGLTVRHFRDDTFFIEASNVYLNEVAERRMTEITTHELGHVLGLNHDCDRQSLMHHSAIDGVIQEKDVAYIRWQMM
jgi:predicted Zn-dependent protease